MEGIEIFQNMQVDAAKVDAMHVEPLGLVESTATTFKEF
jgi:hypothetical protein